MTSHLSRALISKDIHVLTRRPSGGRFPHFHHFADTNLAGLSNFPHYQLFMNGRTKPNKNSRLLIICVSIASHHNNSLSFHTCKTTPLLTLHLILSSSKKNCCWLQTCQITSCISRIIKILHVFL